MAEIPLAPVKRVMKNSGAERVSDGAVEAMRDIIEEETEKLSREADQYAQHAGRKTVKKEDVQAADKEV
ncbi:MAG: histone family protein [Candidatus Nanohaloarchaea archaeon]|nr:histone family protein [Candidatus Nanohaloarchaea archaeon]